MHRDNVAPTKLPTSENSAPESHSSESALQKLRIGQALFATTWRIVVPVVIFTGLGIFTDLKIGSKPWLTLVGVIIGFVLAGILIARLIKESENL